MISGKVFISTRPAGRSQNLGKLLKEQGAELMEMPMIEIQKAQLSTYQNDLLTNTNQFDWIVFTSSNGVIHYFDHLKSASGTYNISVNTKIAVIGKDTGSELNSFGHYPSYTSRRSTGEAFSEELTELFKGKNLNVLLPVGNLARRTIENKLKGIAGVVRLNVYNTEMPCNINYKVLNRIQENNYDMIIFTSNSGFKNFCLIAENKINLNSLRIACIGSTTAEAVRQAGVQPLITSKKMNSSGIAEAIIDYYN